jgi:undecaprenyl-diphosphatase
MSPRFPSLSEPGLHLIPVLAVILAAAGLFSRIAVDVLSGTGITLLDAELAQWFQLHTSTLANSVLLFITYLHGNLGTLLMALLLAWYFYLRRARYWLFAVMVAVPGGMLLNVLLKSVFRRTRPSFANPLLTLPTYSFPSGHAVNATLLYGLAACWLVGQVRNPCARIAIAAGACLMVALVGFSRIYLGVHYLSDVLAGVLEGCAWLAFWITALSTLRRPRATRPGQ